jgi:hypothetical protein
MAHTHRVAREVGPLACADNVKYLQICACGCERYSCRCSQCAETWGSFRAWLKGKPTVDSWYMPSCDACKLRHPIDESCPK